MFEKMEIPQSPREPHEVKIPPGGINLYELAAAFRKEGKAKEAEEIEAAIKAQHDRHEVERQAAALAEQEPRSMQESGDPRVHGAVIEGVMKDIREKEAAKAAAEAQGRRDWNKEVHPPEAEPFPIIKGEEADELRRRVEAYGLGEFVKGVMDEAEQEKKDRKPN